jgi:predicted ABC-class ATPase
MSGESKREREERALDALLVSILRRVDKDDDIVEPDMLPQLTDEEKAAMNALGTDFIDRILAGKRPITPRDDPKKDGPDDGEEAALAGSGADCSLNRAEEIDDETTKELQRREREILERKAREQSERGGGVP